MEQRTWLLDKRNKAKLTQEEVAVIAQIRRPYYTQIESGVRSPSVKVAKEIANAIGFEWTLFFENNCRDSQQNSCTA
ncbi:helix-turn-helix transcriptional regulator [Peribacillus sp. NPDC046944]|uniref:helix-turn-helix transcriptional regulator n=1 Tax=unclassified Peribacillus TaxID=2675266 RepID=UPI003D08C1FF